MAKLVLTIAYSHTPYLFSEPHMWSQVRERIRKGKPVKEDLPRESTNELESKYERCMRAFARLSTLIRTARPDVMIVVGDDQREIFKSIVPGFAIYVGNVVEGRRFPGRVCEVTGNLEGIRIPNHKPLAERMVDGLIKRNFDVAFFSEPENREDGFGHAFLPPLSCLTLSLDLPLVPILVNCYYPPQPTVERCYAFGVALREIIESIDSANKVAVGVSGGLWHTPGQGDATIDERFDRHILELLRTGDGNRLIELREEHLVSGTGEVRNWIVGAGLTAEKKWKIIDYVPLYYSPIGIGFAACEL